MISIQQHIYDYLAKNIENGEFSPNEKMPAESELCKQFSTSRTTVRKAYDRLLYEGCVRRHPGLGTFANVAPPSKEYNVGVVVHGAHVFDENHDPVAGRLKLDIFNGILQKAHEMNARIELVPVTDSWQPDAKLDGYAAIYSNSQILQALDKSDKAYVVCPIGIPSPGKSGASIDFERGFRDCVEYLIGNGHKKIGLVDLDMPRLGAADTFRKVMAENTLSSDDSWITYYGTGLNNEGSLAVAELLERHNDVEAFFFRSDIVAINALEFMEKKGISIPEDISIISYDNSPLSKETVPPLSTYDPNRMSVGSLAMSRLKERLIEPSMRPIMDYVRGEIIERGSVKTKR